MSDGAFGVDQSLKNEMSSKIVFDSPELTCFHEAGHAEAALSCGVQITEIVLYREQPRSYARSRISRTELQRKPIALGGFAVEYKLYKAGRLLKQDGTPPSEKEFIDYAIGNARDDRISYFDGDHEKADGNWPAELDREFMAYAIRYADNRMRFGLVEQIAAELLASERLDNASIQKIVESHSLTLPKA